MKDPKPMPDCPKCKNNRQVWRNQITHKLTCHRLYCDTQIREPKQKKGDA